MKQLSSKYKYHFFFSKHEEYAEKSILISQALEKHGYKIWLSNWKKRDGLAIDAKAMKKGIDESEAVILLLTPGIFEKERVFVTHHELKYAIDQKKLIICIKHWRFTEGYQHKCDGLKPLCSHIKETCNNVYGDFQPYARTIVDLGSLEYCDVPILEKYFFNQVDTIYNDRKNKIKDMIKRLKFQKKCGICDNNVNRKTILTTTKIPVEDKNNQLIEIYKNCEYPFNNLVSSKNSKKKLKDSKKTSKRGKKKLKGSKKTSKRGKKKIKK